MFVGIDFGTDHVSAACVGRKDSGIHLVPNRPGTYGLRTPSLVGGGVVHVRAISERRASNLASHRVFHDPLWKLGTHSSVTSEGKRYTAESVATALFTRIRRDVELAYGPRIEAVVIAIPAILGSSQRRAVLRAAIDAGLPVIRLLSSSAATARAWSHKAGYDGDIVIIDFGAGVLDAAKATVEGTGTTSIKHVTTAYRLGGRDWNNALRHRIDEKLRARGTDADSVLGPQSDSAIETAKLRLAAGRDIATVWIRPEGLPPHRVDLTKQEFEVVHQPLMQRYRNHIEEIGGLFHNVIVITGRASQLPGARELPKRALLTKGRVFEPSAELVAQGAALEAEAIVVRDTPFRDSLALPVWLSLGETATLALKAGIDLPSTIRLDFRSPDRRYRSFPFTLRQGPEPRGRGKVVLAGRLDDDDRFQRPAQVVVTASQDGVINMEVTGGPRVKLVSTR